MPFAGVAGRVCGSGNPSHMTEILHQLGNLIVGSVPTMILFILLIGAYNLLVRRPLEAILLERRARTVGAVEQARGAISAAEAETTVYEDKLRSARGAIQAMREQKLAAWAEEREQTLGSVRTSSAEQVETARAQVMQSTSEARRQIEAASGDLSQRILAALLPAGAGTREVTQ